MGERVVEAGWVGPWREAFNACVRWSLMHGHRHRIRWSSERAHWRITCLTPPDVSATPLAPLTTNETREDT